NKELHSFPTRRSSDLERIIITTYTANTNEAQQQLVEELQELGKPVIIAALGNPYDLIAFPEVDAYINTYSYLDVSIPALADVIVDRKSTRMNSSHVSI